MNNFYAVSLDEIKPDEEYRCRICKRDKSGKEFTKQNDVCDWCIGKHSTVLKICTTCGVEFWDRKNKKGTWCSDKCDPTLALGKYRVFERDEFRCIYCGKSSIENAIELQVDHIVPRAEGGTHHIANLVTACASCNRQKSATPLDPSTSKRLLDEVARRNEMCGLANRYIRV